MIIIQDSREQAPLTFIHDYITETRVETLPVGDYGCEFKQGWQCPAIFERKSIPDLFGSLGKDYERFRREIERANSFDIKLIIIIEGTFSDIILGHPHSKIEGISIIRRLFTIWIKYGVPFICCSDRSEMALYIAEYYSSVGRKALRDLKQRKKPKNE